MMFKTNRLDELILPLVNTTETNSSVETKPENTWPCAKSAKISRKKANQSHIAYGDYDIDWWYALCDHRIRVTNVSQPNDKAGTGCC